MMKTIISAITTWAKSYFKQADWKEKDKTSTAYIKNKPTIPTKLSSLANDVGYVKAESIPNIGSKIDKINPTGTGSFSLNRKQDSAIGDYSFAEGFNNTASGNYSHAEGYSNIVEDEAPFSHAEGSGNVVKEHFIHAEGYHNIADVRYMHVQGKYNIPNNISGYEKNKSYVIGDKIRIGDDCYICIKDHTSPDSNLYSYDYYNYWDETPVIIHAIGNGLLEDYRSNAHTIDSYGNAWFSGDVYTGSTSGVNKDDGSKKLATEEYVSTYVTNNSGNNDSKMDKTNPTGTGSFSLNRLGGDTVGSYSFAEGYNTSSIGEYSHTEGYYTKTGNKTKYGATPSTVYGYASHAEGYGTVAKGSVSHAEGNGATASGHNSHAEGYVTTSGGNYSHAEGYNTVSSGLRSHAEGFGTRSAGDNSHAEGYETTTYGYASHVEGRSTISDGNWQHVQGKFNISDSTSAHIVGNGNDANSRSNAHTLDWDGNAWYAGDVYIGSTSGTNKDDGSKKLATEEYVDSKVNSILDEKFESLEQLSIDLLGVI